MKISKFEADNMREALAQVKRDLGPDAMVISTRQISRGLLGSGVEVTAAIDVEELPVMARPRRSRPASAPSSAPDPQEFERALAPLKSELRSLRSMVRARPASPRRDDGLRREIAAIRAALLELGEGQRADIAPPRLPAGRKISAPSRGRVIALVGPTGVGKTTTIAKLAARAALTEGKTVAVVTIDNYRVGAEQQMRMYTDLIGVPLITVNEPAQLAKHLATLAEYDIIYVDTAGRSPRDEPALAELASAFEGIEGLELHLTISAGTSARAIAAIFQRFRTLPLDRLLFTKVDEAVQLDQLVRAPATLWLPVSHITIGQSVPEDLEDATDAKLVQLATTKLDDIKAAA